MEPHARIRRHRRARHTARRSLDPEVRAPCRASRCEDPALQCRHQRQHEEPVRDRLAAGHLPLRALAIDVNPEVVAGHPGEVVDVPLLDSEPVALAELLADMRNQVRRGLQRSPISSPPHPRRSRRKASLDARGRDPASHRRPLRELLEPRGAAAAPVTPGEIGKAEVEIAERTADRDVADAEPRLAESGCLGAR